MIIYKLFVSPSGLLVDIVFFLALESNGNCWHILAYKGHIPFLILNLYLFPYHLALHNKQLWLKSSPTKWDTPLWNPPLFEHARPYSFSNLPTCAQTPSAHVAPTVFFRMATYYFNMLHSPPDSVPALCRGLSPPSRWLQCRARNTTATASTLPSYAMSLFLFMLVLLEPSSKQ